MGGARFSPLLLLGALGQRLHVELSQVPAVLVPPQVPLLEPNPNQKRRDGFDRVRIRVQDSAGRSHLSKPHAVPLVGRLLRLGRVHQLEAGLVLLVEVGILTAATELR